jgi:hypothetical protein
MEEVHNNESVAHLPGWEEFADRLTPSETDFLKKYPWQRSYLLWRHSYDDKPWGPGGMSEELR